MTWSDLIPHIRHLSAEEQDIIRKAFDMGKVAHEGQTRKSGEPYFSHPIAVAGILGDMGADAETITAALLHDTIEDTTITDADIKKAFGPTVLAMVDGVTKLNKEHIANQPTLDAKIETLRKMFTLMQKDVRIMVIKLADRLHNMQTAEFLSEEKQKKLARETLDIYVKIAERLSMTILQNQLEELCLQILDPGKIKKIHEIRMHEKKKHENLMKEIFKKLSQTSNKIIDKTTIELEEKKSSELESNKSIEGLASNYPDINIVFICPSINDCYLILGLLHQSWRRETLSFNDFINTPQINGYKGIHTTIILDTGIRIRCKIRTIEMHEYAQYGVTTQCFDGKMLGILEYLPWTQRISQLSKDTHDQSEEFWNTLQSDILGDSIVIHSTGAGIHLLPKGATALDGAYYIYGKKAHHLSSVMLNGENVPFHTPLSYAMTVTAAFDKQPQVSLKWLQHCNTGVCTAMIRTGLEEQERNVKIEIGKNVLQNEFDAKKRGYLEEINTDSIRKILQENGHTSLEAIYIQIAEGRVDPKDIEKIIFKQKKDIKNKDKIYTFQAIIPSDKKQNIIDIIRFYRLKKLRTQPKNEDEHWNAVLILSPEEMQTLHILLEENLKNEFILRERSSAIASTFFSVILFILWGFDPAVTRVILTKTSASPIDMTIIFFITLTLLTGGYLLWIKATRPLPEARLSVRNVSLWLSGILLFCVALTTYLAMQDTFPSHYTIPMTAAGLCLTTIVNRKHKILFTSTWLIVLSGTGLLLYSHPEWNQKGILFTILSILAFTGFSIISERYKRMEHVSLRAAQYFFLLSILGLVLTIPLTSFATFNDLSLMTLSIIIVATILFSGLPYYIYYYLLSHKEMDFVLRYSFLIIPGTLLGEYLLIQVPSITTLLSAIIVIIGAFLPIGYLSSQKTKN